MLDFNSNKEDLYIYDRQIDFFFLLLMKIKIHVIDLLNVQK